MPIKKRNLFIPRNQRLHLTGALIKKMDAGNSDYLVRDETERRLHVKVTPKGRKSFIIRYRSSNGVERKYKLGDFPDMNVTTARRLANRTLLEIANGNDPATAKSEQRRAKSFREYSQHFMREYAEVHLREKTRYDYNQLLNNVLVPAIGNKKLHDITRGDVAQIQRDRRDTPYQANRAVKLVRRIFNYAIEVEDLPFGTNPTNKIKLFSEKRRERLLSKQDMQQIGTVISELTEERPNRAFAYKAILFLFLTGCRKSEALRLRWEDVDLEHRKLKFRQTKTGPRDYYITNQLRSFFESLDSSQFSDWIFPGRNPDSHVVELKKPWDEIRARTGLHDVRLHDVRHTFITNILSISDIQTAADVAGHKNIRSTMQYIHSRSDSTREAMENTASTMSSLLLSDETNQEPEN